MSDEFPFLIGRVALTDDWSIDLPFALMQRFDEQQMVLWREGFTVFLSVFNNDTNETAAKRKADYAEAGSDEKFDEFNAEENGVVYYSYRVDEPADDDRKPAFEGFAFADHGHLLLSIYFDEESDVEQALELLRSASGAPPVLEDTSVLSGICFATNMVMEDGKAIGYMYREEPDAAEDSGWRFLSGYESQEYMDDPANTKIYPVAVVAEADPVVIPYLDNDCGHYGREGDEFFPE